MTPGPGTGRRSAPPPTTAASTSRCGPSPPTRSRSASSTTPAPRPGCPCRSAPSTSGTATCRGCDRASGTASASTGPGTPSAGLRFNPAKLLADPYARAIEGELVYADEVFGHAVPGDGAHRDRRDSAPYVPRSVVVRDGFDWGDDRPPAHTWEDTVLYELHVKGFTKRHPGVPPELRGTYAGLAHPAAIEHLTSLGVTAVELLPVHHFVSERHLAHQRLSNYWGYNSLGYFAPHAAYAASGSRGQQVGEFKAMVKALHEAGLEVILDVVYNHTAEGNHEGPTLCFRGLDNRSYYQLQPDRRYYADYTGTRQHPRPVPPARAAAGHGLAALLGAGDARRRLPLRPRLARWPGRCTTSTCSAASSRPSSRTPCCRRVKLIAEPWDVGSGGYQVGEFPPLWSEWNDQYRDTRARLLARLGRGAPAGVPARRLVGPVRRRRPAALRLHQLRHRPRRLHAARPGQLRPQAQRRQRRAQPRRHRRQPLLEPRRRGRHRRPGGAGRPRSRRCAPCWRR